MCWSKRLLLGNHFALRPSGDDLSLHLGSWPAHTEPVSTPHVQGGGATAQSRGRTKEGVRELASLWVLSPFETEQRGRLRLGCFSLNVNDTLPPAAYVALNLCQKAVLVMCYIITSSGLAASLQSHIDGHFNISHFPNLSICLHHVGFTFIWQAKMKMKPTCTCHLQNVNKLTSLLCVG